jgi:hypothetical protein
MDVSPIEKQVATFPTLLQPLIQQHGATSQKNRDLPISRPIRRTFSPKNVTYVRTAPYTPRVSIYFQTYKYAYIY